MHQMCNATNSLHETCVKVVKTTEGHTCTQSHACTQTHTQLRDIQGALSSTHTHTHTHTHTQRNTYPKAHICKHTHILQCTTAHTLTSRGAVRSTRLGRGPSRGPGVEQMQGLQEEGLCLRFTMVPPAMHVCYTHRHAHHSTHLLGSTCKARLLHASAHTHLLHTSLQPTMSATHPSAHLQHVHFTTHIHTLVNHPASATRILTIHVSLTLLQETMYATHPHSTHVCHTHHSHHPRLLHSTSPFVHYSIILIPTSVHTAHHPHLYTLYHTVYTVHTQYTLHATHICTHCTPPAAASQIRA